MKMTEDKILLKVFDQLFNLDQKQSFRVKHHSKNILLMFIIAFGFLISACTQKDVQPPQSAEPVSESLFTISERGFDLAEKETYRMNILYDNGAKVRSIPYLF